MCDRQSNMQVDVADRLARKRARAHCRCNRARAALLLRLRLQDVAVVSRRAGILRRHALADAAEGVDLLAERRALGDARVELAIDDALVRRGRLEVEKVRARFIAALQYENNVAVGGGL